MGEEIKLPALPLAYVPACGSTQGPGRGQLVLSHVSARTCQTQLGHASTGRPISAASSRTTAESLGIEFSGVAVRLLFVFPAFFFFFCLSLAPLFPAAMFLFCSDSLWLIPEGRKCSPTCWVWFGFATDSKTKKNAVGRV